MTFATFASDAVLPTLSTLVIPGHTYSYIFSYFSGIILWRAIRRFCFDSFLCYGLQCVSVFQEFWVRAEEQNEEGISGYQNVVC